MKSTVWITGLRGFMRMSGEMMSLWREKPQSYSTDENRERRIVDIAFQFMAKLAIRQMAQSIEALDYDFEKFCDERAGLGIADSRLLLLTTEVV